MDVALTPEEHALIREAIVAGRIEDAAHAVKEAMALWVSRERRRTNLLSSLDAEEAALASGEGIAVTQEAMKDLAEDVMRRCAARLKQA